MWVKTEQKEEVAAKQHNPAIWPIRFVYMRYPCSPFPFLRWRVLMGIATGFDVHVSLPIPSLTSFTCRCDSIYGSNAMYLPFAPIFMKTAGLTEVQIGLIGTVRPFVSFIRSSPVRSHSSPCLAGWVKDSLRCWV
eukprot:1995746-Rhodomonas_salina.1